MSLASAAERVTQPLDWGLRHWFRWIARGTRVRSVLWHPDRRIATQVSVNVALAAAGAIYFPVLLFTLGPVLLGVAHVAADVRYLALRRGLARCWQNTVWVGCLALILVRLLEQLGLLRQPERVEFLCRRGVNPSPRSARSVTTTPPRFPNAAGYRESNAGRLRTAKGRFFRCRSTPRGGTGGRRFSGWGVGALLRQ